MAKVKTIVFSVDGKECAYNINVSAKGVFSLKIDWDIAKKLGIDNEYAADNLQAVERPVLEAALKYKESSKSYSLYILINYTATGFYSLEGFQEKRFKPSYHSIVNTPAVGFDYKILIREDIAANNTTIWYEAKKIDDSLQYSIDNNFSKVCNGYATYSTLTGAPTGSIIPYSPAAVETLDKVKAGIKSMSEILYNVLKQDPDKIERAILQNKLIGS